MTSIDSVDVSFNEKWQQLVAMEERVGRKGFTKGELIGTAEHEIRSLVTQVLSDRAVFVAAGDKNGVIYTGCFDRETGRAVHGSPWRKLPHLRFRSGGHRVVDVLQIVQTGSGARLVVGTRGNGAWMLPLDALIAGESGVQAEQLVESANACVRRLLYDDVSASLWCGAETRCIAWSLSGRLPEVIADVELGGRATAFAIDRDADRANDQLYIATNRLTVHRLGRGGDGRFIVGHFADENAIWRGRSSVVENMMPLSDIVAEDNGSGARRRRFRERGVIATTLRHVMVIYDAEDGRIANDSRRVTMYSKILAAAPLCFPHWQGIAVATLEKRIRLFHPSAVRRPNDDSAEFDTNAPENARPSALLAGYDDIEFMRERVYAINVLPPVEPDASYATMIVGTGDHIVRLHTVQVSWEMNRQARNIADEMAAKLPLDWLLEKVEAKALHSTVPAPEKYACSMLLPGIGRRCSEEQWKTLDLVIWDILAGTEEMPMVPIQVVQSLRRLQSFRPDRREEIEQTITRIRKHIFDKESFSGKNANFLGLTNSTDDHLEDDRAVYKSILISRRHDPVFEKRFEPDEFGEVKSFESIPGVDEEPADIPLRQRRFLVGTYRSALWVFDGEGGKKRVTGFHSDWGYVHAMLCMPNDVIFGFSRGFISRASRAALTKDAAGETTDVSFTPVVEGAASSPVAFSRIPAATADDERFLWGDASGAIHLWSPAGDRIVFELLSERGLQIEGRRINVIQTLRASVDGRERSLVVAGTDLGYLVLLEWIESDSPALQWIDTVQAGAAAVTSLLAHREHDKQVVAACADGNVTGWWVTTDDSQTQDRKPTLHPYWAFGAGEAVQQLRRLEVNIGSSDGDGPSTGELIAISSHDNHLHIVDHAGRHLETIHLPDIKLDRFVAVADEADKVVEARIYATAFENQFLCFRLISRRRMLDRFGEEVKNFGARRETYLSRWRSYALREGHLRHRFIRQSRRYPGADAAAAIDKIRRLMELRRAGTESTGEMIALLRRLFQNRRPHEPVATDCIGLREILGKPDVYKSAVELLVELEGKWDRPGSVPNRRVQYFWIRSLLREIEDIAMLRRWLEAGDECPLDLAKPARILDHYLEQATELMQFKVLQALERMLVGWPGVPRGGVLSTAPDMREDDIEWVLLPLLSRLRLSRAQIEGAQPNVVVMQIGKILCHLIRLGCLGPLYLTDRLQRHDVSSVMYTILMRQCAAMARRDTRAAEYRELRDLPSERVLAVLEAQEERLREAATIIGAIRNLDANLKRSEPPNEVVKSLEAVVAQCGHTPQATAGSDRFIEDAAHFYNIVLDLLRVTDLKSLEALDETIARLVRRNDRFAPSLRRLAKFANVVAGFRAYYRKQEDDRFGNIFEALTFEALDSPRQAWRTLESELRSASEAIPPLELKLLAQIADVWNLLLEATHESLLQDFLALVIEHVKIPLPTHLSAREAAKLLASTGRMTETALRNLFVRLTLYSEPGEAALFYRGPSGTPRVKWLGPGDNGFLTIIEREDGSGPPWLTGEWLDQAHFSASASEELEADLNARVPHIQWQVLPISEMSDTGGMFGFLIFGWRPEAEGKGRYESAEALWTFLLQSLIFKKAALQQHALRGNIFSMIAHNLGAPVFHLCSDSRILVDRFPELELNEESRFAKYDQILREARHMQGIIDAILSIDGREPKLNLKDVSLASVTYDVVRTLRVEARVSRNVTIHYDKPEDAMIAKTKFNTDEIRIYDIMLNLVTNAVKYSPQGGVVRVDTNVGSRGALLTVHDNGPDVPEDERKLIFQPFFRGRGASHTQGLGLGLFVADIYAKALKGRISISHVPGEGKSFVVFLPHYEDNRAHSDN